MEQYRPSVHADTVVYFLIRLPCQVHESTASTAQAAQPVTLANTYASEVMFKRCFILLKRALVVWPEADPKLSWLDKLMVGIESNHLHNIGNTCAGLELLTFIISKLKKEQTLASIKSLYRGFLSCCGCSNPKVIKLFYQLLMTMFTTYGIEEFEEFVNRAARMIQEVLSNLAVSGQGSGHLLYPSMMVLKAISQFSTQHLDRLIAGLMKVLQRVLKEHITGAPPIAPNTGLVVDTPSKFFTLL